MKKILFSNRYGLTQAVLEGRKTMTRRIVPECKALDILRLWERYEGAVATGYEEKTQSFRFDYCPDKKRRISIDHLNLIPRYKVGEVVAVAQPYCEIMPYLADSFYKPAGGFMEEKPGYRNKMFVRADLMPHQIRIKDVRVQHLQEISDEDCLREGIIEDYPSVQYSFPTEIGYCGQYPFDTPRDAFAALIDKISGKGTWDINPRVFVYEFELVK